MGKIGAGYLSAVVNKLGGAVGRVRLGVNVLSVYQPNVANPRTTAQLMVRLRFSVLSNVSSVAGAFLAYGFKSARGTGQTAYNVFMRRNYATGVEGTYPSYAPDYTKLQFSAGSLSLPFAPAAGISDNELTVGWTDNSGVSDAAEDDMIGVMAYNSSKHQAVAAPSAATRQATTFTMSLPTVWTGDSIEVYLYATNADNTRASATAYLGSYNL